MQVNIINSKRERNNKLKHSSVKMSVLTILIKGVNLIPMVLVIYIFSCNVFIFLVSYGMTETTFMSKSSFHSLWLP